MRADTHYSIGVRSADFEKPKYTFSQVGYVFRNAVLKDR